MAIPYGKYLLERKLTEGGMAEIFLAKPGPDFTLDRKGPIVVKRLFSHHSSEAEFVRMFLNEARLASRLKHPNIVDIFDQGEVGGTHYLAMEYIAGEDLRGIAQRSDELSKRPPLPVVCRIIMDMLLGLHHAHTLPDESGRPLGLVHRDISPQNVLVTYDGVVKVIDFGIAKATQSRENEQTQAGLIKGKYAYMSPEQTRSGQLDARSDVFSAGIMLWELITWRRLFKRGTDLATLVAVTEEPAPSMILLNPDVPKELDEIVLKSLAMEPQDRWDSAKAFVDALQAFVNKAGWDASREALGRFMRELFYNKIIQQQSQARAAAIAEERASAASMRQAGKPGAVPAPAINKELRATMPLQVINPAMAAAARKARQQLDAAAAGKPAPPTTAAAAPEPAPRGLPASAKSLDAAPLPPTPSSASLPLEPMSARLRSPLLTSIPPTSATSSRSSGQSQGPVSQPPASAASSLSLSRSDPNVGGEKGLSSRTIAPPATTDSQKRVIFAVLLGVVIGVLAVLMLQIFGRRH